MFRTFAVALFALLVFAAAPLTADDKAADKPEDVNKADLEKLQGKWIVAKGEAGGQELPKEFLTSIVLTFDGEKYTVEGTPDGKQSGEIKIDGTKEIKEMTVEPKEGPNAGMPTKTIYKFDEEKLIVCYDLSNAGFPKEFKAAEGDPYLLITYERKKEEEKK
jgi:uncharacterized protein (TIGR03067 family)